MKKLIDYNINVSGTVEVDIPEELLDILEESYRVRYYYKTPEKGSNEELEERLFNIINNKVDFDSCEYDKIEIYNVEDVEDED